MTRNHLKILAAFEGAVIGASVGFGAGLLLWEATRQEEATWGGLSVVALVVTVFWFKLRLDGRLPGLNDLWPNADDPLAEGYAIAEAEVNDGSQDAELWSKALVAAKGSEEQRKIEYMKLRVKQMKRDS